MKLKRTLKADREATIRMLEKENAELLETEKVQEEKLKQASRLAEEQANNAAKKNKGKRKRAE